MLRKLHSLLALIATVLLIVLAITGAILSVQPMLAYIATPEVKDQTVAELAQVVSHNYTGVESIQRTPSGSITVYYSNNNETGSKQIDPKTGLVIASMERSTFILWIKDFHRSLLLGNSGRAVVGMSALLMFLLSVTGIALLVIRLGGWRALFRPVHGSLIQWLHCSIGRFIVLALLLTSITGSYLSAVRFNFLPAGDVGFPDFPIVVDSGDPLVTGQLVALKNIKVKDLEELVYPYQGDTTDVFSVTTSQGMGYIDQATGKILSFQPHSLMYKLYEFIYRLHTGEGFWWLGVLLGIASLNVPVICITGIFIWWQRHRSLPKISYNCASKIADTLILVGSEGNQTWGFAKALHDQLTQLGYQVKTTAMNDFEHSYPNVKRFFILTSTFGDGDAPASAKLFLKKLELFNEDTQLEFSVLGFGDRQFPHFGRYAKDVNNALEAKGFISRIPLTLVDRQSSQAFTRWGWATEAWLDHKFTLSYTPKRPTTIQLELIDRVDYGVEVQAPTSIFRFRLLRDTTSLTSRFLNHPHFEVGDFIGIFASENDSVRFYSLASSAKDGFAEICVRQQEGGVCSNYLHGLSLGDCIAGFMRSNLLFKPLLGKSPLILIGAGTGIGPLFGFIRQNSSHRPIYLYWGGRDPQSDFLYQAQLNVCLADKRLTELNVVFSRVANGCYVQSKLQAQGSKIQTLVKEGAQVMVCGGRDMAAEVKLSIDELLIPVGCCVADLKSKGNYLENVY